MYRMSFRIGRDLNELLTEAEIHVLDEAVSFLGVHLSAFHDLCTLVLPVPKNINDLEHANRKSKKSKFKKKNTLRGTWD